MKIIIRAGERGMDTLSLCKSVGCRTILISADEYGQGANMRSVTGFVEEWF